MHLRQAIIAKHAKRFSEKHKNQATYGHGSLKKDHLFEYRHQNIAKSKNTDQNELEEAKILLCSIFKSFNIFLQEMPQWYIFVPVLIHIPAQVH